MVRTFRRRPVTRHTRPAQNLPGLALDPTYIKGFVEGCLERIGDDDPKEERLFRALFEDETQREVVKETLTADCEVGTGQPPG